MTKTIFEITIINLKGNSKFNHFYTYNQLNWEFNFFISLGLTEVIPDIVIMLEKLG